VSLRRTLEHGARTAIADKNRADFVGPISLIVLMTLVAALLERRADPTLAQERALSMVAGLALPVICLLGSRVLGLPQLTFLSRHGANRRTLWLGWSLVSLALSLFFVLALLTSTTFVTRPVVRLDELVLCWGVLGLGSLAYHAVFGFVMRRHFALTAAGLWLVTDSWLGSSDHWLRYLSIRGHLMNLLFELRGHDFSPRLSSVLLLGTSLALLTFTWFRTPA